MVVVGVIGCRHRRLLVFIVSLSVVGLRGLVSPLSVFIVSSLISRRSLLSPCLLVGWSSVIVAFLSHLSLSRCRSCHPLVFGLRHHRALSLRRLVGRRSSSPCRSVVSSSVVVGHWSSSSCRRSVVVFVWRRWSVISPRWCSSTSSLSVIHIVVCCLPWSSSSVMLSSRVQSQPLSVVAHRSLLSVVVRHLWLSVVCGCPLPIGVCHLWLSVNHRLWSSVNRCLWSSVICGQLSTVVCGRQLFVNHRLWSTVDRHLWSTVDHHLWLTVDHCLWSSVVAPSESVVYRL